MKRDFDTFSKITYYNSANAKSFSNSVSRRTNIYQRTDISDMYDSYFDPNFGLNRAMHIGHNRYYFGDGTYMSDNVAQEAFAEMFSATITGNQSLDIIKQHFPDSYKLFEEMIKEAIK